MPVVAGPKKVKGGKAKNEALRQKIIASNKKKEEEKKKEAPPIKEKIETPEEMFFRNLNFIEGQYLKNPGESGFVDINDSSRKKILRVLESIINKKKTSKFTKPEKEVLERVFKFYKSTRAPGQSKKDIENFESFLNSKEQSAVKKTQKTIEEKKKGNVERNKISEIRKGINRIKDIRYLREIIDEWNGTKKGKALEKTRGQPLRNTDNITKLKQKIMSYKMYEDVKIKMPPVVERKKMTAEEKAQKATEKKAKDALEKPILTIMLGWKQEFKDRKKDGQDEKELLNELEDRWDDLVEEHEEDAFDDDDFLDAMEKIKDTIEKNIKGQGKTAKELAVDIADNKDFKEGFKKKKK